MGLEALAFVFVLEAPEILFSGFFTILLKLQLKGCVQQAGK